MPGWTDAEDKVMLLHIIVAGGPSGDLWQTISAKMPGKTAEALRQRYQKLRRQAESGELLNTPATPTKQSNAGKPGPGKAKKSKKFKDEVVDDSDDTAEQTHCRKRRNAVDSAYMSEDQKPGASIKKRKVKQEAGDEEEAVMDEIVLKTGDGDFGALKGSESFDDAGGDVEEEGDD